MPAWSQSASMPGVSQGSLLAGRLDRSGSAGSRALGVDGLPGLGSSRGREGIHRPPLRPLSDLDLELFGGMLVAHWFWEAI